MRHGSKTLMSLVPCCVSLLIAGQHAKACLRASPDARAVQWSSVIVEGKLTSVAEPVELTRLKEPAEVGKPPLAHAYFYQLYTFDVTDVLDGRVRRGQDVRVVRFFGQLAQVDPDNPPCSQHLRKEQVGQSFILLLRPERESRLQALTLNPAVGDIRTEALHKLGAYVVVNLVPRAEMDADEKAATKQLIADARRADREYSAERARNAAERVATSAEAPESEAEANALLAMGPRAIPEMTRVWNSFRGPRSGRDRLQVLIAELTPPAIPVAVEGPMVDREAR